MYKEVREVEEVEYVIDVKRFRDGLIARALSNLLAIHLWLSAERVCRKTPTSAASLVSVS